MKPFILLSFLLLLQVQVCDAQARGGSAAPAQIPELEALRASYLSNLAKIQTYRDPQLAQQEQRKQARQYLTSLENLQRRLTSQKEIAKAAFVDAERASIPTELLGPTAPLPEKKNPAASTVAGNGRLDFRLAGKIAEVIRTGSYTKTDSSGAPGGNVDIPASGALLVGFEFQEIKKDKGRYMRSLRPYFMTGEKTAAGIDRGKISEVSEKVMAKDGYAVGGLLTVAGCKGIRVIFMKIDPATGRLDTAPNNTYISKWIGTTNHDTPKQVGGDGRLVIGVYGVTGEDADTIGLIQMP